MSVARFRDPAAADRLPGCDDRCTPRRWLRADGTIDRGISHAPAAHEQHGARWALGRSKVIRTGSLVIDSERGTATVDGRPVAVTTTELALLVSLAARVGCVVPYRTLMGEVFGDPDGAGYYRSSDDSSGCRAILRRHLSRLRQQLGPAGGLISTYSSRGLELRDEPPTTEAAS